ncbi:hypothetical protein SKAU_G00318540 [Synaphobranchus kaupii]|uniref:Uncharacterized protein n=1 Tax=Synaphobranchus kaupii TaxID=118154 RepID=A0A9Q1ET27_SYNKA|nr:hypothetical protein SKAU_G00318540 [Synaphobranchus kaupii]
MKREKPAAFTSSRPQKGPNCHTGLRILLSSRSPLIALAEGEFASGCRSDTDRFHRCMPSSERRSHPSWDSERTGLLNCPAC